MTGVDKINKRDQVMKGIALPFVGSEFSAPSAFGDIEFRPIKSIDELKSACNLVYEEYRKLNYIDQNMGKVKFTLFQALPLTTTYVAIYKKKHVLATLTAVVDSPLGLPMESLYRESLDVFRSSGRRLFEATMFASDPDRDNVMEHPLSRGEKLLLVLYLFRSVFDHIRSLKMADMLVGCWHPRHEVLYQFMQMKEFGELKAHDKVKGNPAVARYLDIRLAETQIGHFPSLNFFFGLPPLPGNYFSPKPALAMEDLDPLYLKGAELMIDGVAMGTKDKREDNRGIENIFGLLLGQVKRIKDGNAKKIY